MKIVTNVSGGRSSAYVAANYPADALVFSLVRIEDQKCTFPDKLLRGIVEDKIQAPFIGTAEDDIIIHTMLDLEQFLGRKINWVTGPTFEELIRRKGNRLPNRIERWCTSEMKILPIFYWWARTFGKENPVITNIGFRAREAMRANKMLDQLNARGFIEMKGTFQKGPTGRNKWLTVDYQRPRFPLIEDGVNKDLIEAFWKDKPVRFADYNNCVGCFNRNPVFLRFMFQEQPEKMAWFRDQESGNKKRWHKEGNYTQI